jgi:hypothetical protein
MGEGRGASRFAGDADEPAGGGPPVQAAARSPAQKSKGRRRFKWGLRENAST